MLLAQSAVLKRAYDPTAHVMPPSSPPPSTVPWRSGAAQRTVRTTPGPAIKPRYYPPVSQSRPPQCDQHAFAHDGIKYNKPTSPYNVYRARSFLRLIPPCAGISGKGEEEHTLWSEPTLSPWGEGTKLSRTLFVPGGVCGTNCRAFVPAGESQGRLHLTDG